MEPAPPRRRKLPTALICLSLAGCQTTTSVRVDNSAWLGCVLRAVGSTAQSASEVSAIVRGGLGACLAEQDAFEANLRAANPNPAAVHRGMALEFEFISGKATQLVVNLRSPAQTRQKFL